MSSSLPMICVRQRTLVQSSPSLLQNSVSSLSRNLGAHLRGRTATQRSKKGPEGPEKVPGRALGKLAVGFTLTNKGSEKGSQQGF